MRLNGESFTLNAIMIEQIQSYPDTTITLVNGKKIVVKNPEEEVTALMTEFYQKVCMPTSFDQAGVIDE